MTAGPYSFGPFRLDPTERRLTRDGDPLEISGRYLDALALLAAEGGKLVTKDRFMDEVWRGVPVTDEALTQCIRSLRKALGDDAANPRVIETVPRHGYRLLLPVDDAQRVALLAVETNLRAATIWPDVFAAGLGGGGAGIVAALGYLASGFVAPQIGTASTLLVLLSTNLLLGFVGGASVGLGIALASRGDSIARPALGGATGGMLVGAIGRMVGTDLFTLFFGLAPERATGAVEGTILGLSAGLAIGLARRRASVLQGAIGIAAGALAGVAIAAIGGRLMAGSLAGLAERFPANKLAVAPLGPIALGIATVAEATLFVGGVVAAVLAARRLRG